VLEVLKNQTIGLLFGLKSVRLFRGQFSWNLETSIHYATRSPGKIDATKVLDNHLFALEWETGNISSSHRAVNKMVLGWLRGIFLGAVLVLPSRKLLLT
jgi:hypothetical protein